MSDPIPDKISPDQYDKLSRRLWEMEQRIVGYEKSDFSGRQIDKVFDRQSEIEKQLKRITKTINTLQVFMEVFAHLMTKRSQKLD